MTDVTHAMALERPAKAYVRDAWMSLISDVKGERPDDALYTTLCGGLAMDIRLLIQRGLIGATEVGGILTEDAERVFAIESSPIAVTQMKQAVPGLNVIAEALESIVSGTTNPQALPNQKHRRALLARVLNLDFNGPLQVRMDHNGLVFHHVEMIRKIATLRGRPNVISPWSLLVTLGGQVTWDVRVQQQVMGYLRNNRNHAPAFSELMDLHLDSGLVDLVTTPGTEDLRNLSMEAQQEIVGILFPKRVCEVLTNAGWRVRTRFCWRYGGNDGASPMCTWGFDIDWDPEAAVDATGIYHTSLEELFKDYGTINDTGSLSNASTS